jgi:hypothetical protein
MNETVKLVNPYSLDDTLAKLRYVLSETSSRTNHQKDALDLLEKAVAKSHVDLAYANEMEETLLRGSTVAIRKWLAVFGDYLGPPKSEYPWYPHHDAVNGIDTAMHVIKFDAVYPGAIQEHIGFVNQ